MSQVVDGFSNLEIYSLLFDEPKNINEVIKT